MALVFDMRDFAVIFVEINVSHVQNGRDDSEHFFYLALLHADCAHSFERLPVFLLVVHVFRVVLATAGEILEVLRLEVAQSKRLALLGTRLALDQLVENVKVALAGAGPDDARLLEQKLLNSAADWRAAFERNLKVLPEARRIVVSKSLRVPECFQKRIRFYDHFFHFLNICA